LHFFQSELKGKDKNEMKNIILTIILFVFVGITGYAQDSTVLRTPVDRISIGLGAGLDYGGFGYNMLFYPQKNIGLFGGIGYAVAGIGANAGIKLRLIPTKASSECSPFLIGMYGYNAAVYIINASEYNKLYYGYTAGIGIDYCPRPDKRSYWSFALLFPQRDSRMSAYIEYLTKYQNVVFLYKPWSVCFSISSKLIIK
jgi:hypothetical protein